MRKISTGSSRKSKNTARKTAKIVKPLYAVSALTKNSSSRLWVSFPKGKTSKGLVFSSTLSRDAVRNATAKTFGVHMNEIRSRRVKSFRKIAK